MAASDDIQAICNLIGTLEVESGELNSKLVEIDLEITRISERRKPIADLLQEKKKKLKEIACSENCNINDFAVAKKDRDATQRQLSVENEELLQAKNHRLLIQQQIENRQAALSDFRTELKKYGQVQKFPTGEAL